MAKAYNYELAAALKEIMEDLRNSKKRYGKDVTAYNTAIDVLDDCSAKEIFGLTLDELHGKRDAANAKLTLAIAFLTIGHGLLYELEKNDRCEITSSGIINIVKMK